MNQKANSTTRQLDCREKRNNFGTWRLAVDIGKVYSGEDDRTGAVGIRGDQHGVNTQAVISPVSQLTENRKQSEIMVQRARAIQICAMSKLDLRDDRKASGSFTPAIQACRGCNGDAYRQDKVGPVIHG